MMMRHLEVRASQLLDDLGAGGGLRDGTLELLLQPDATGVTFTGLGMLGTNGDERCGAFAAPWVIDLADGRVKRRCRLPVAEWTRRGTTMLRWSGAIPTHEVIRLAKRIPQATCREHCYGRSGALRILLDRPFPLMTVQIFPGGCIEATNAAALSAHGERLALVLLALDGVRPTFHLLPAGSADLSRIEIATEVTQSQQIPRLEADLLRQAEEDRRLLLAAAGALSGRAQDTCHVNDPREKPPNHKEA